MDSRYKKLLISLLIIKRYMEKELSIFSSCLVFGKKSPEGIILQQLVDDGCSSRSHRKNIFNPNVKVKIFI